MTSEERCPIRVLRIRKAQFRGGRQVALPADDRAANPGLNPDVVVPVNAEDQGLHCTVSTGPMIYQAWWAVCKSGGSEEAEALLDPPQFNGRRPRSDDRTAGVRDDARPDLRGAVVRGGNHDRHPQRRLEDLHLARAGVRMAEDPFVRRDRDAADRLDARDGPADDLHAERLPDERDRFVVVAGMDDGPVVVAEDVVPDRAEPVRQRIDRVPDRLELRLLDERRRQDPFRIHRDEGAHDAMNSKGIDRKSTRLNSSHDQISYAVFCLKKKRSVPAEDYGVLH